MYVTSQPWFLTSRQDALYISSLCQPDINVIVKLQSQCCQKKGVQPPSL